MAVPAAAAPAFPYPCRGACAPELAADPCAGRLPGARRAEAIDMAWERGAGAARRLFPGGARGTDFARVCADAGLRVVRGGAERAAGRLFFAEYLPKKRLVVVNTPSLRMWADRRRLRRPGHREDTLLAHVGGPPRVDLGTAVDMALCHEYFHHLEWTRLGLTSLALDVPLLRAGPIRVGRVRFRSLSEIGAYGFTHECFHPSSEGAPQ